ncbi:putative endosome-associated ubiquitin isopeptidase (AmsH) [Aspergillus saccharolyticus JOP 1030-1]|uniref:Endosome-associated ubiquitin isopeptidase n=1 Tax=Aspergillus saccharolyticus JOP 1030-1 TaxID=1450539 RepID=A0A318ZN21_9EURO|nr:endosome-associated ubiquitin isopeptidase [Aspergillus saccharolyticus JOP 1030-1]PYH47894.1 endosome-associated ubiquitin isopeptidase [Aspergillus saccharolyticus JOP 1030-1]
MAAHLPPTAGAGASPPQSVESITRLAQDYEYNPSVPLRYWLRTASTLIREARIYEQEQHEEQAYLLLFRHAQLVLVNLAEHPEAKDEKNRKALVEAEKEVKRNLKVLETLKPRITKRYERYTQLMRERQQRASATANSTPLGIHRQQPQDPALAGVAKPLEAGENRDLAVKLARTEISRRATVRKAIRQAGISPEEEQTRRAAGVWGDWEHALRKDADDDLSQRIHNVRLRMDGGLQADLRAPNNIKHTPASHPAAPGSSTTYKYPSVPRQRPLDTVSTSAQNELHGLFTPAPVVPALPPKELPQDTQLERPPQPPRPDKLSLLSTPALLPTVPAKVRPTPDSETRTDLDPSSFTFKPSAYLENGTPLRTLFLPPELRTHFLSLAAPNTQRNLETCGILCGTLISNALFVSRLLIPEQTATSDTCETVNETAIFDYCDSEDLMVLGWIHTHPTQTCFMSSRDLHTHCGYQVMLPESIAIVCAPSKMPDWGVFRLTDPPGLKTVLNCTQPGLFHPHGEANIYTDALRPGHVFEAKGLEFETVDLRPNGSSF